MLLKIKELKIDEEDNETGVTAISFVDDPAIETTFQFFNKQELASSAKLSYFRYDGPNDDKTRDFCKKRAGKVFSSDEIKNWVNDPDFKSDQTAVIPESNFFSQFDPNKGGPNYENLLSFNCDAQMFGCRHRLIRVTQPPIKSPFSSQQFVKFNFISEEKREVVGLVLRSNQTIPRLNVDGQGNPGYIYFSRATIRKLKEKYGWNRTVTLMHQENITGSVILLDSWLEENDTMNETKWFIKYKIVDNKLWSLIKEKKVVGFSLEALFR